MILFRLLFLCDDERDRAHCNYRNGTDSYNNDVVRACIGIVSRARISRSICCGISNGCLGGLGCLRSCRSFRGLGCLRGCGCLFGFCGSLGICRSRSTAVVVRIGSTRLNYRLDIGRNTRAVCDRLNLVEGRRTDLGGRCNCAQDACLSLKDEVCAVEMRLSRVLRGAASGEALEESACGLLLLEYHCFTMLS